MGNTHDTEIARIEADFIHTKWRTTDDYRWGYTTDRGPETWWLHFPSASGGNQSPIDIVAEEVTFDPELCQHPLTVSYPPPRPVSSNASDHRTGLTRGEDDDAEDDHGAAGDDEDGSDGGGYGADYSDSTAGAGGAMTGYAMTTSTVSHGLGGGGLGGCSGGAGCGGGGGRRSRETMTMINTGNAVRIDVDNSRSVVTGGPCREYCYVLEHVNIHWGEDDSCGSEHLVDSHPYGAEIHLIHWNEDLYDSYDEAAKREDGIVIVAVFVKVTDDCKSNKLMSLIADKLEDVPYRYQATVLPRHVTAATLLPDDTTRYWTYRGSFTTPPCFETVTWVLFHDPISVNSRHLAKFRELRSYGETEHGDGSGDFIITNCRPQQPIGTRKVYTVENHGHELFVDGVLVGLQSGSGRSPYASNDERPFRQTSKFVRPSSYLESGGGGSGGSSGLRQPSRRA